MWGTQLVWGAQLGSGGRSWEGDLLQCSPADGWRLALPACAPRTGEPPARRVLQHLAHEEDVVVVHKVGVRSLARQLPLGDDAPHDRIAVQQDRAAGRLGPQEAERRARVAGVGVVREEQRSGCVGATQLARHKVGDRGGARVAHSLERSLNAAPPSHVHGGDARRVESAASQHGLAVADGPVRRCQGRVHASSRRHVALGVAHERRGDRPVESASVLGPAPALQTAARHRSRNARLEHTRPSERPERDSALVDSGVEWLRELPIYGATAANGGDCALVLREDVAMRGVDYEVTCTRATPATQHIRAVLNICQVCEARPPVATGDAMVTVVLPRQQSAWCLHFEVGAQ